MCACPTPWSGMLCRRVRVLVPCVVAGSMLGLFCCCPVVSPAVRLALSGVGRLWCLPGRDGRAGLASACGAPPPCPSRVRRAGHPSTRGAPPRVFVSQVPSPCRSCSLALPLLSHACAAPGRALVFVTACPAAPPTPPHPTPPQPAPPLVVFCPPLCLWSSCVRRRLPPPPREFAFCGPWGPAPRLPLASRTQRHRNR